MNNKLKIGRIPYANLFPIFYMLETGFDCSGYEFVEGVPSEVNKMLREGEIDVSPSSSIEYLRNQSYYCIIEGNSISSRGPVGSVLLVSNKPVGELGGAVVHVSFQSETSVALLDIMLRKFYNIRCRLEVSEHPEQSHNVFLLIGDDAMKYIKGQESRVIGRLPVCPFIYDLGEIWHKHTGLPFVFALWIVRKETFETLGYKKELLDRFIADLNSAKDIALKNLPEIARRAPMKSFMSEEEIISYWNNLDYELTVEHKNGLELFGKYLEEIGVPGTPYSI